MGRLTEVSDGKTAFLFETQLQVEMAGSESVIPDIVAFEEDILSGTANRNKVYWIECKIDRGSEWSSGQKLLKDEYVGTGSSVEVRSAKKRNLQQGDLIELKRVLQLSVNEEGLLIITIK